MPSISYHIQMKKSKAPKEDKSKKEKPAKEEKPKKEKKIKEEKFKKEDVDSIISEFTKLSTKKLKLLVVNLPEMDTKSPTQHEKYIIDNKSSSRMWIENNAFKGSKPPFELKELEYTNQDLLDVFTIPEQEQIDRSLVLKDRNSSLVNIRNGYRVTTNQPKSYCQTVWMIGGPIIYGYGNEDSTTIASYLQDRINKDTKCQVLVKNCGEFYYGNDKKSNLLPVLMNLLQNSPIQDNDILIIAGHFKIKKPKFLAVETQSYFTKPYKYGECFFELWPFLNKNGSHLVSDAIFDCIMANKLLTEGGTTFQTDAGEELVLDQDFVDQLNEFKQYLSQFKTDGRNGGVYMNADPFTLNDKNWIETASKMVDHLYVFISEDPKTMFPFNNRLKMIKDETAEIGNVIVVKAGMFPRSGVVFGDHFAPTLNIGICFIEEEPFCQVEQRNNDDLKSFLPKRQIKVLEVPRKKFDGEIISAGNVRALLKRWQNDVFEEGDMEKLQKMVSPHIFDIIKSMFEAVFPPDDM